MFAADSSPLHRVFSMCTRLTVLQRRLLSFESSSFEKCIYYLRYNALIFQMRLQIHLCAPLTRGQESVDMLTERYRMVARGVASSEAKGSNVGFLLLQLV
jgi:hypothetical protein